MKEQGTDIQSLVDLWLYILSSSSCHSFSYHPWNVFIQHLLINIKHLLCTRQFWWCWAYTGEPDRQYPCPHGAYTSVGEVKQKSNIYDIRWWWCHDSLEILGMLFGNDKTPQQRVFLLLLLSLAGALVSLKITFYPSAVILCDLVNKNTDSSWQSHFNARMGVGEAWGGPWHIVITINQTFLV